jgi:hypothetical protein
LRWSTTTRMVIEGLKAMLAASRACRWSAVGAERALA